MTIRCPKCGYSKIEEIDRELCIDGYLGLSDEMVCVITCKCTRCHFSWKEMNGEEDE